MIVVTGGTGLLGAHLLVALTRKYDNVLCLYRNHSKLKEVERVFSYNNESHNFSKIKFEEADLDDYLALEKYINEGDTVYHCAALISFDPREADKMIINNHNAALNVVNVCLNKKVFCLCHVSSVAALGKAKDGAEITEKNYWKPEEKNSNYALSKYLAENEVWRGIEEGLKAVIVNPAIIIGEGFWASGSGNLFVSSFKNKNRFYTNGITGYVDVKDVVNSMILLVEFKKFGQRYILSADNYSYRQIFTYINESLNLEPPKINVGRVVLNLAWRLNQIYSFISGKQVYFSSETARAAIDISKFDNSKICKELQIKFQPIEATVKRVGEIFLRDRN
jgi:nucleoside-diphosphate-sugar epimerase